MTGVITSIRNTVDRRCFKTGKLSKSGCTIYLTGTPNKKIVIDFDSQYSPIDVNTTRCDYLYSDEENQLSHVVPLELKKGDIDSVTDVKNQLQAGAFFCQTLISAETIVRFVPVLASGSMNKHKRNEFRQRKNRIKFHQKSVPVSLMSCGGDLIDTLRSFNNV